MIRIHREKAKSDFLGIKNENWKAASRDLGAHALRLYLYLAANADDYKLALSPAAILEEIGMPRSTYHDQFRILVAKGYLVANSNNGYDFFERPQPRAAIDQSKNLNERSSSECAFEYDPLAVTPTTTCEQHHPSKKGEINNRESSKNTEINIDTRNNQPPIPKAKEFIF